MIFGPVLHIFNKSSHCPFLVCSLVASCCLVLATPSQNCVKGRFQKGALYVKAGCTSILRFRLHTMQTPTPPHASMLNC